MSLQDTSTIYFTGPILLGHGFNWGLFGILTIQICQYWENDFRQDGRMLKVFVTTLYAIDTLQTILSSIFAWDLLVAGWGNEEVFNRIPWSGLTLPILSGVASGGVQLFFAWRIWNMRRMHFIAQILSVVIVLIALTQALCAIAGGVLFAMTPTIMEMAKLEGLVEGWLAGAFICDTVIAGTMIFILNHARRESSYKTTGQLMKKLMYNAVETGLVTAITAGVELALFLRFTDNFLHMCPNFILSKLYTNVVLANLNNRKNLTFFTDLSLTQRPGASDTSDNVSFQVQVHRHHHDRGHDSRSRSGSGSDSVEFMTVE